MLAYVVYCMLKARSMRSTFIQLCEELFHSFALQDSLGEKLKYSCQSATVLIHLIIRTIAIAHMLSWNDNKKPPISSSAIA